ncbi:rod shape-determining protein RodA [Patescibacteria group bacterium]|nr:rod shape-determining protein RodA [Patescibacteria group bacterium]
MNRFVFKLDWLLVFLIFILASFSLLAIASVSPDNLKDQIIFLLLGFLLLLIFSKIDYHFYGRFRWLLFAFSTILILVTFFLGVAKRGSVRWIDLFGFSFQPSEVLKPLIIVYFASFLDKAGALSSKKILFASLFVLLPGFFIFLQPDLGTSLIVFSIWLAMVFSAGISWPLLTAFLASFVLFVPLGWQFLKNYQKTRIFSFLNPQIDPLGSGYNLIQAVIAVGSGKLFGRGLGRGTQSHLRFLPEKHTDFIFASLAEEIGFAGSAFLVTVIFVFLIRILKLCFQSKDRLGYLMGIGIFSMLAVQFLVNISMNLGIAPITGITLPLISYGGSSIIAVFISLGILFNIFSQRRKTGGLEIR